MKVLLVDQFYAGPTPYELSVRPMPFEDFVAQELHRPKPVYATTDPQLLDVDESYNPPYTSTVFRADKHGMAEAWKMRWDSSG